MSSKLLLIKRLLPHSVIHKITNAFVRLMQFANENVAQLMHVLEYFMK